MDFTVIIPTHNREKLLLECINSLTNQNYPNKKYEIIIVNDGSTDNTDTKVKELKKKHPNIRYFRIKHSGCSAARNLGLRNVKGKFIAFTDDDCVVERDWLKKIEENFKRSGADAVGGSIVNPTNRYIAWSQYILNFSSWFPKGKNRYVKDIPTANIAYRKKIIKNHFFRENLGAWVYSDSLFNYLWNARGYEDALYNFYLYSKDKKILFCPEIKVRHFTWKENYGLKKFFGIQKKAAIGFMLGGYVVHGMVGRMLFKLRFLNLFCPRLIMVLLRCLKYGYFMRFALCFPLLLAGEFYRGLVICSLSARKLSLNRKTNPGES